MIQFAATVERTFLVDPSGARAEQSIEHRIDPLMGTIASINTVLGEKAKIFLGTADVDLLTEMEQSTKAGCPFCNASEKGTRFLPEFVAEGQLRAGNALAMPNLFSKCAFDSVVVLDHTRHVLFPSRIGAEALANGIRVSAELVRRARARDPKLVHHVVGMNFLNPGGSSVPHPHFQAHVRGVPYSAVARTMRRSARFHAAHGRSYWAALVEEERALGLRHLGRTGDVEWIAAYAPAHQKEIWGVLPGVGSLAEIEDQHARGFAEGIAKVISFYERSGTHPFTFAFLSSPDAGWRDRYALHVKICSRPAFRALYSNYDTWFIPKLIGDDVHVDMPERYAEQLRSSW
jgi:UDPglucose--hexose-1-phosphate uridylyltransferase